MDGVYCVICITLHNYEFVLIAFLGSSFMFPWRIIPNQIRLTIKWIFKAYTKKTQLKLYAKWFKPFNPLIKVYEKGIQCYDL